MMTRLINLPMGRLIRMCLGVRRSRGNVNWCQLDDDDKGDMWYTHFFKTLLIHVKWQEVQ